MTNLTWEQIQKNNAEAQNKKEITPIIAIGIACNDEIRVQAITSLIYDNFSLSPQRLTRNNSLFIFDLVSIDIFTLKVAQEHKFDFIFCDDEAEENYVDENLKPICNNCIRPLSDFIRRIENNV